MDSLIDKTQSYRSQAEDYRNNCIQGDTFSESFSLSAPKVAIPILCSVIV